MHEGQLNVETATVRELVAGQFPQWRGLPVCPVSAQGTVNALFRLGDCLVARFPLVPAEVSQARRQLQKEADAARELAGRTRFATPRPVAIGEPGAGYPLPWSVQTWLPGSAATPDDLADSIEFAHDLVAFIVDVRAIGTSGRAFSGTGRGGDLREHDEWMATCFQRSEALLDIVPLRRLWSSWRELPRVPVAMS